MNKPCFFNLNKLYAVMVLLSAQNAFAAANFNIAPYGSLPTTVTTGQTVTANFTITNMTYTARNGYTLQGFPATVTQNTTSPNCGNPINLVPHANCNLQLDITGAVSSNFAICKLSSCTTATTPLNVTLNSTPLVPTVKYVYVANGNYGAGAAVFVCTVDPTTELINSCQDAGGGSAISAIGAQGIILNNAGNTAYLTNGNGDPDVYQCPINSVDGTFGTCVAIPITTPAGFNTDGYGMLTMNPTNTVAYLVDTSNNRIDSCSVTGGNINGACVTNTVPALTGNSAEGIIINKKGDTIYLADYSAGVYVCDVNGMTINTCVLKTGGGGITFTYAVADISLNPDENLLYVTDYSTNEVYACDTTPNGTPQFNTCFVATSAVNNAGGVVINAKNTVGYVTDFANKTYSCPILPGGIFDDCTPTNSFQGAIGLALGY